MIHSPRPSEPSTRATRGLARVATFAYHEATDDPHNSGFQRTAALPFKLPWHRFAEHLDRIATAGCQPELVPDIDPAAPGHHLLLTFDDGGKSALPIAEELARRGWRGHFFVVTSLLDTRTFLSTEEVRALRGLGHLVGTHSHTHPDIFRDLSPVRMAEEWRVSRDRLSEILGEPCGVASVPGGDISDAVLRTAGDAGLRYVFTSEPWLQPRRVGDVWAFGRFVAKRATDPARVATLARFRGWTSALILRWLGVLSRRAAPFLYRAYVRHRTRQCPDREAAPDA